ncbi:MAG: hypothetical protein HY271_14130 [Deltaproteobacteria bacterium]|nr:hypothetical protein [Deltaproteobacteria bacterium]
MQAVDDDAEVERGAERATHLEEPERRLGGDAELGVGVGEPVARRREVPVLVAQMALVEEALVGDEAEEKDRRGEERPRARLRQDVELAQRQ